MPPTYRSEAKILVERQTVPSDIVSTTVTSYVQEQIEQIRQEMTSYENLLDLADKFGLYAKERISDPKAVVQKMQDAVEVNMVDVYVAKPNEKQSIATIAFTVAFSAPTPDIAQRVTQELSERYLDLHKASREKQAAEVSDFIGQEADQLKAKIADQEKQLASFKQNELHQLPELMDMNLRLYDRTEQDIDRSRETIRSIQERVDSAQAELSLTEPYKAVQGEDGATILTGSQRLSALTAEYLNATSRYSAQHPDVIRLRNEIRVLGATERQRGPGGRADVRSGTASGAAAPGPGKILRVPSRGAEAGEVGCCAAAGAADRAGVRG